MAIAARAIEDDNVSIGEEEQVHEPTALGRFWNRWSDFVLGSVAVILFLALWEWTGTSGVINPLFTSAPSRIVNAFIGLINDGTLGRNVVVSGLEFVYGFGLAILVGVPLGILMGWYRPLNAVLDPFVNFFYATPRVALLPLMIIWLGIGINSKIAVVYLGAIFGILINTITGMHALDPQLINAARSFGASDYQIFKTIALPGSVPFILGGIRLALDTADAAGYAALFAPDALLGMNKSFYRGRQEIEDFAMRLTGREEWAGSQHYNDQVIIERADGSRCTIRSYSTILVRHRDGSTAFKWLGIYRDVCVKVDGEWLFEERLWEAWDPDKTKDEYRVAVA